MADPTNHNEAGEVAPSTVDQQAPEVSEANAPSTNSPKTTAIPSANAPDPTAVNPETNPNAAGEKSAKAPKEAKEAKEAKAPKKEKGPSVEDKPFADFIQQDYFPALKASLAKQGVADLDLALVNQPIPITGYRQQPPCWQVVGSWENGNRQFNIYFFKDDIQGQRGFSYADYGSKPSTLEPFLIDERKVSLELLVFGAMQRLYGQKWLVRN